MKFGFAINDLSTECHNYTTMKLAYTAETQGHEAWVLGVGDFIYSPDGAIHAVASRVSVRKNDTPEKYLKRLQSPDASKRIVVDDLDVLMLRNDPSDDAMERPWAQTSGILFGQLAVARGVIVVNDPEHLADAINKTYFQHFPEIVRPRTCISRSLEELKAFIDHEKGNAVIKPLQGSGGHSVFLVRPEDGPNLNQMLDAVLRDGYVIAQEYLPAAVEGDVRMFMVNGRPLEKDGAVCAVRRVPKGDDARSNISAGGEPEAVEITDDMMRLAEIVRPKLVRDGMYMVGLDIVGDKLMEINVFSPGGLNMVENATGVDFSPVIIDDLVRKVRIRRHYGPTLDNVRIATA